MSLCETTVTVNEIDLVEKANHILQQVNIDYRVQYANDITPSVFVILYERLLGQTLKDVIREPRGREQEIHNCQVVIDSLSMDILDVSLSYITGDDIVRKNRRALDSLLEIFKDLTAYILAEVVETDASTDVDDMSDKDILARYANNRSRAIHQTPERDIVYPSNLPVWEETRDPDYTQFRSGHSHVIEQHLLNGTDIIGQRHPHATRPYDIDAYDNQRPIHGHYSLSNDALGRQLPHTTPAYYTNTAQGTQHPYVTNGHSDVPKTTECNQFPNAATRDPIQSDIAQGKQKPHVTNGHSTITNTTQGQQYPKSTHSIRTKHTDDIQPSLHHNAHHKDDIIDRNTLIEQRNTDLNTNNHPRDAMNDYCAQAAHSLRTNQEIQSKQDTLLKKAREALLSAKGTAESPIDLDQYIETEHSVSLVTPDLPQKDSQSFDFIGVRPRAVTCPAKLSDPKPTDTKLTDPKLIDPHKPTVPPLDLHTTGDKRLDGQGKTEPRTYTHHLFHHNVPAEVTAAKLQAQKGRSTTLPKELPPYRTTSASKTGISKTAILTNHNTADNKAHNISLASLAESDQLHIASPRLREALQSIHSQSALAGMFSSSPPKYPTTTKPQKLRQQNVFDRLYENPISISVTKDANTSDRRVVELRDKPKPRSRLTQTNVATRHSGPTVRPTKPSTASRSARGPYVTGHTRHHSSDTEIEHRQPSGSTVRQKKPTATSRSVHDIYMAENGRHHSSDTEAEISRHQGSGDFEDQNKKRVKFVSPPHAQTRVYAKSSDHAERKFKTSIEYLCHMYEQDLQDVKDEMFEDLDIDHKAAEKIDEEFKKKFLVPKKSLKKSTSASQMKRPTPGLVKPRKERKRSQSASPSVGRLPSTGTSDSDDQDDLVTALLEEFPYLYISGETWHELWRKGIAQIESITRKQQEMKRSKTRTQAQFEEADRKQDVLHQIMKKQIAHTHRLRETKARRTNDIALRNRLRDKRVEVAGARRYYEEFQMRMRAKMLKKRTREEMVFKQLFKDGLDIQKERVQDIQNYAKQQKDKRNQKQKNELESIENFYRDQFELLAASVAQDRQDLLIREKAQSQVLDQMKRDLRTKMESEIREIQDELFRDDDHVHFREVDADRIRDTIKTAAFHM